MPNYGIFFRGDSGSWSGPVRMDDRINPPDAQALSPYVTPDGKYFFFASTRKRDMNAWASQGLFQNRFLELHNSPQNGNADIYWVDAKIINELKEKIR